MDIKVLIGIFGRPWLMEPAQAQHWGSVASSFLATGTMPASDKREFYTKGQDFGAAFRLNYDGSINNDSGPIQVFKMDGPVAKADFCGSPGSQTYTQMVNAASSDPTVKGGLLWIDGPGGQVDGTENLANAIRAFGKPMVTFSDGMMCSAHYWIGSSTNEIIVDGANAGWNATIGSIGTMAQFVDDTGKLAKNGEKRILVFADDSADKWGDYFSVLKGDYTRLKQELNGINATFKSAVMQNREGKLKLETENVLTGKTYNANEALKYGLIDKIGTFSDSVKRVAQLAKTFTKNENSNTMSGTNLAFQNVLTVAGAEAFQVVEGGFLMTEEHMNAVDAKLGNHAVALQEAQAASAEAAGGFKELNEKLEAAQAAATQAKTELEASQAKVAQLEEQIATANDAGKSFFGTNGGTKDPAPAHEATDASANFAHNKTADEAL